MGLLAWTASVRAQCLSEKVALDLPITTTAVDQSDHAHTINVVGASYTTGEDGMAMGALNINGQNQYATIPADPAFEAMSNAFTMAAWVYPVAYQQYNAVIAKLNGSHRNILLRYHNDGKIQVHFTNGGGGISAVTTDSVVVGLNNWYHIAATWDGNEMRIYVNGELKKDLVLTQSPTFQAAGSVRLGTLNFGSERMRGYLDNVQLRAFTTPADEIACLMRPTVGVDAGIELHLPLNNSGVDVSDNANSAAFYQVGVGTDRWGNNAEAVNLTGSGYATIPNIPVYEQLENEFTISAWINPSVVGGTNAVISKAGTGRDIVLRIDNGKLTAHYYVSGYTWCSPATATVNANEWSHIACTWDGTNLSIYHNGELLQSVAPTTLPNFTSNDWSIGALTASGQETFSGQIDEVKVWHRHLSICELRSDIHANWNLISEDNLLLCEGQSQIVSAPADMCSYLWANDNSTADSYSIDASSLGVGDHQIVVDVYDRFDNFYSDTVNVTVSLCTGINEPQKLSIMNMYPNPASSMVTVNGTGLSQIELLDISGRLLESVAVVSSNSTDLNVGRMPSGVYFVRATAKDGTVESKRLIKH